MSPNWQRARSPERKDLRRSEIVGAARALLSEGPYEAITLKAIAEQAGIVKSALYRYFESKEEIFLFLYIQESAAWAPEVVLRLSALPGRAPAFAVARILARSISDRTVLARLMALRPVQLEPSVSSETRTAFRESARSVEEPVGAALSVALPDFEEAEVLQLLFLIQALVAGLWPMTGSVETGREAAFARELHRAISALIRGF